MTSGLCITNVILNLIIFSPSAPAASNDLTISTPSELCTFLKENQPRHRENEKKRSKTVLTQRSFLEPTRKISGHVVVFCSKASTSHCLYQTKKSAFLAQSGEERPC